MRIPLDYYRILSVPIKATPQQLEQAYGDRAQQKPRREYSDRSISARLRSIEEAYSILSDPDRRNEYDAQFFANTIVEYSPSKPDASDSPLEEMEVGDAITTAVNPPQINPTIEVLPENFVGALSILHELGEYELVLKLGLDYLNSADYTNLQKKLDPEDKITHKGDVILSLALAYLELGREQWHRREYENAARSGTMGLDLLMQEGLFPSVQEELEVDLYKLRPYRILESIAQNSFGSPERTKGFKLLTEMLRQREGIEGKGKDRSGLTFEQFLCFIQQLRTYLTSSEQEELFSMESQEKSAIARYLAVYALIARGFALKQPQLVLRAQNLLKDLSQCQDVYWEQAICALLLSNTHKAVDTLKKSQDKANIELIEKEDPAKDDLLPGLCLYGEKWLQEDVIAQFCDLENIQMTLNEYFADLSVQSYIEQLSPAVSSDGNSTFDGEKQAANEPKTKKAGFLTRLRRKLVGSAPAKSKIKPISRSNTTERELVSSSVQTAANAKHASEKSQKSSRHSAILSPVISSGRGQNVRENGGGKVDRTTSLPNNSRSKNSAVALKSHQKNLPPLIKNKSAVKNNSNKAFGGSVRQRSGNSIAKTSPNKKNKKLPKSTLITGWLFIAGMILGLGGLGFVSMRMILNRSPRAIAKNSEARLTIAIDRSTVEIPPATPVKTTPKPEITFSDRASQVIQTWLDSKSAAFGEEYKIEELNKILAPPLLATWRDRAAAYQQGKFYREYEHKITMRSAKVDPSDSKKATVEAEVKEVAKHYEGGKLDSSQSYDDNLLVRYQLVLQGDKWLIQNSEVLKTL